MFKELDILRPLPTFPSNHFCPSFAGPLEAAVAAATPFQPTAAIADAIVIAAALIDVLRIENAALAKCEDSMRAAEATPIQHCMHCLDCGRIFGTEFAFIEFVRHFVLFLTWNRYVHIH